jgi:hypothetical protein
VGRNCKQEHGRGETEENLLFIGWVSSNALSFLFSFDLTLFMLQLFRSTRTASIGPWVASTMAEALEWSPWQAR